MGIVLIAVHQHRNHRKRRHDAQRDTKPCREGMVLQLGQEPVEQRPPEIDEDDGHKNHDF